MREYARVETTEAMATWKCGLHYAMIDSSDSLSMSSMAFAVYALRYTGSRRIIALLYIAFPLMLMQMSRQSLPASMLVILVAASMSSSSSVTSF